MTVAQLPRVRTMPAWLSILVVLASLAAAAAAGWWFWKSGPTGEVVLLKHNPGDGVHATGKIRWDVRAGIGLLRINRSTKGETELAFDFTKYEFLTQKQIDVLSTVRRIVEDNQMASQLEVSPEQLSALRQIRKGAKVELDSAQTARLRDLFVKWEKAPADAKSFAEDAFIDGLENVAQAKVPQARKSAAARADLAQATLTAAQWRRFEEIGK